MGFINSQKQGELAITDRATQYGDGCFSTIGVKQGKLLLWSLHVERLQQTLRRLAINEPNWDQVFLQAEQSAATFTDRGGVKILISRGCGGRGYSSTGCDDTTVIFSTFNWPAHYEQWQKEGILLGVCQQQLGYSPMLAGMKHLNRLEQVLLKQEVEHKQWLDAVVLNTNNHVIETTASNIFWRKGNIVYTPDLTGSGVEGVMRRHVITLLSTLPYTLELGNYSLPDLLCADEVFITNALMELVPIKVIDSTYYKEQSLLDVLKKRLYTC
ncbi:4-amino-4-deoxychorismate lyase [Photobacterium sp. SKA34]|uniref:aminodeoxychorismate lyase n=1 Tax=Photobacterium sp. SKA34 TaxID=121723 RepID=UPI00006B89EA|nr:aminodeoxychorismate lyase [Photobacterium sp. SKA34]EAR55176.1 4-amino-4-deoxychorismate lyase [Photobacterium sp. SKA34]